MYMSYNMTSPDKGVEMLAVVAMFVLDGHYNLGLYQLIISNQQLLEIIEGSVAFVLICSLGMNIKHRAFMHSFFCMVALSFCVFLINPDIVPFFMKNNCLAFDRYRDLSLTIVSLIIIFNFLK